MNDDRDDEVDVAAEVPPPAPLGPARDGERRAMDEGVEPDIRADARRRSSPPDAPPDAPSASPRAPAASPAASEGQPARSRPVLPLWVRVADVLTVAVACVLASNLLFDGVRLRFGDTRITATDPLRTAVLVAILLGARHWLVRTPAIWTRLAAWGRRVWSSPTTAAVVSPFVASRVSVLLAGYLAVVLVGFPGGSPPFRISRNELVNLPMRWDAGWYLGIALDGYHYRSGSERQQNVVFFPAYPVLTRVGAAMLGAHGGRADSTDGLNAVEYAYHQHRRIVLAGMLISLVAFGWALAYLFRLAREMLDDAPLASGPPSVSASPFVGGGADTAAATGAVLMTCAYPFSLFYSAFYTESLFLLTLVGAFYHFRRGEWGRAAAWALVLGLTRPNGCLISVPLGLMALQQALDGGRADVWWRRGAQAIAAGADSAVAGAPLRLNVRRFLPAIATAAMPGIGMLIYSAFLYRQSGNAFAWLQAQRAWGRVYEGVGGLFAGHVNLVSELGLYQYSQNQPTDILNGGATVIVLLLVWPIARRLGLAYAVLLLLMTLPPLAAGGFLSMGRMTSTLFPVFLYLGWRLRGTNRTNVVMACAVLQGFLAVCYFTWRPIF